MSLKNYIDWTPLQNITQFSRKKDLFKYTNDVIDIETKDRRQQGEKPHFCHKN